jgi:hypothetical protein
MTRKFPIIRLNMPLELVGQILAEAGAGPDADELQAAPVIDLWQPILTPTDEICLTGRVTQHPLLGLGHQWVATSQLLLLDQSSGWCRTANRFYRLGRLSEVRGIDMPPTVRFPSWAREVDIDDVGILLDTIARVVEKLGGS